MPWWAARTSNPVDAAKRSGSIPPLERFFDKQAIKCSLLRCGLSEQTLWPSKLHCLKQDAIGFKPLRDMTSFIIYCRPHDLELLQRQYSISINTHLQYYYFQFRPASLQTLMNFDTVPKKFLITALAAVTLGGGAYLIKNIFEAYGDSVKNNSKKSLSLETTRQLIQQIKYQTLIVSVNFYEKMSKNMANMVPTAQLNAARQKLKENIMNTYASKEEIVLNKHLISKELFGEALVQYQKDEFISKNAQEIENMIEKAVIGQLPDISVPEYALTVNSKQQIKAIYFGSCLLVIQAVWTKMHELSSNDPTFDSKNDDHFKVAIRAIKIYELKANYLKYKGYNQEWGCPNEIFFKVLQHYKIEDLSFRSSIIAIQKSYNTIIEMVSNNPLEMTASKISELFQSEIKLNQEKQQKGVKLSRSVREKSIVDQTNQLFQKGRQAEKQIEENKFILSQAKSLKIEPKDEQFVFKEQ